MEREEIEAMWERIKALEENSLEVARQAASFEVLSTYNFVIAMLLPLGKPKEIDPNRQYMESRCESAQDAALGASSAQETLEIAADFQNDYIAYLRSRK